MSPSQAASVASEIVNLLLIAVLVPITIATVHKLRHPGRGWLLAGYLMVAAVGIWNIAERYLMGNPTNVPKQTLLAAAGVAFAIGCWKLALALRAREIL